MQNETWYILTGNAKDKLKELEDNSVQCCITSPPYYGLRDYGTTGVVALKQKRKYIGVDLNEEYVELASNRLQAAALEMSKYNLW